jgi:hypothetical protein
MSTVSNRKLLENDTTDMVDNYIDSICTDPTFLCAHQEMCGKNTTIYKGKSNVEKICKDFKKANECESDIKQCVVQSVNSMDQSKQFVVTSFINIIVPIPNVKDELGNQMFIRLPPLSSSKKPDSKDLCNLCACMDRFAKSPGGKSNTYTSPGQNQCVFNDGFEYYYYPLEIENLHDTVPGIPPVKLGKYTVFNKNIITISSQSGLSPVGLYDVLLDHKVNKTDIYNFIKNVLYVENEDKQKELDNHILNLKEKYFQKRDNSKLYSKNLFFFIILIAFLYFVLKKSV